MDKNRVATTLISWRWSAIFKLENKRNAWVRSIYPSILKMLPAFLNFNSLNFYCMLWTHLFASIVSVLTWLVTRSLSYLHISILTSSGNKNEECSLDRVRLIISPPLLYIERPYWLTINWRTVGKQRSKHSWPRRVIHSVTGDQKRFTAWSEWQTEACVMFSESDVYVWLTSSCDVTSLL